MDTMDTMDLISECANYVYEEAIKRGCEHVCISSYDVARALKIPFDFVYQHDREIKRELNKFPLIAWIDDNSGFDIELWEIPKKGKEGETMGVVVAVVNPDDFRYTDAEKVKALNFTVSMLKEKLQVLEIDYPEMKYTANKLKGCIEEIQSIADRIESDMEVNFCEDLNEESDSDPYAVEWR